MRTKVVRNDIRPPMNRPAQLACRLLLCLVAAVSRAPAARAQEPPGTPTASKHAAPLLREAQSLYDAGRFAQAEQRARASLTEQGESPAALYLLGHSCQRQGKARESLQWFTRAAATAPPTADDLRTVGLDYVLLNDYPDANHWLERAVTEDPRIAEAWYDLGRARMMQEKMVAAEQALTAALRLQPRMARAQNNLGVVYEAENRMAEAIEAYRKAIDLDKQDQDETDEQRAQPLLNLGTLLRTQQHAAEALPLLRQAVALAPDNSKAHEQLARALEEAGDLAAAVAEMQIAVRLAPGEARLHFELGQLLRRAGNPAEAERELRLSGQLYGAPTPSPATKSN